MFAQNRFSDEFRKDAVSQVVGRGYSVAAVAERLGVRTTSIYTWKTQFSNPGKVREREDEQAAEIRRLKRDPARVTEERNIYN